MTRTARPGARPKKSPSNKPSTAKLDRLIEEATVDAYDETEQVMGFCTMLEDHLAMPFKTHLLGLEVTVERVDMTDDEQIVVVCARGKLRHKVPILDLPLPDPRPKGSEWIDAYGSRFYRRRPHPRSSRGGSWVCWSTTTTTAAPRCSPSRERSRHQHSEKRSTSPMRPQPPHGARDERAPGSRFGRGACRRCAPSRRGELPRHRQIECRVEVHFMGLSLAAEKVPLETDVSGVLRVGKTRVALETVIAAFSEGATAEEILQQYPSLNLADIYQVIGYYLRRTAEVEAYLQERRARADSIRQENESRFDPQGVRNRLLARRPRKSA